MKVNVHPDSLSIIGNEIPQKRFQVFRPVNDHGRDSAGQPERGKQREKPEQMVSVDMGYEDGIQLGQRDPVK